MADEARRWSQMTPTEHLDTAQAMLEQRDFVLSPKGFDLAAAHLAAAQIQASSQTAEWVWRLMEYLGDGKLRVQIR